MNKQPIRTYQLQHNSAAGAKLVEVLYASGTGPSPRRADFLVPHRRKYYMLALVQGGQGRHWVDMHPYTLQPNIMYFSTPTQVHVKEQGGSLEGTLVYFTAEFLATADIALRSTLPLVLANPANAHTLQLSASDQAVLTPLFEQLLGEFQQPGSWQHPLLGAYLRTILLLASRCYEQQYPAQQQPHRALLQRFTALLDQHYATLHQVADYARHLHLSPGHLNDSIKYACGRSAVSLIHERLALEAQRQLFYTDRSVAEVAFALGFADPAYFSRFFRRLTSQSPVGFRTATREMYR